MKILKKILDTDFQYPENLIPFIPPEDFILFDIETTGLSHAHAHVILIGYITYENGQWTVTQILCTSRQEEKELLFAFSQAVASKTFYMTFNGQAFDIPFTNSRMKKHGISCRMDKSNNLDILRLVRNNKEKFPFSNYKLKTIEKHLGIEREDTISGKDSVELYKLYEKSGDPNLEKKICLHNYEDIIYLLKLLDITRTMTEEELLRECPVPLTFPRDAVLGDLFLKGERLQVKVHCKTPMGTDYMGYGDPFEWRYDEGLQEMTLWIPVFSIKVENTTYWFIDVDLFSHIDETLKHGFNGLSYAEKNRFLIATEKNLHKRNIQCFYNDYLHKLIHAQMK